MNTIHIATDEDFFRMQHAVDLPNCNMLTLIRELQKLYDDGLDLYILSALPYLPQSYVRNPAMLAKNCKTQSFKYIRTSSDKDFIRLVFTNDPTEGKSFLSLLREFLDTHTYYDGALEVPTEDIPESYRQRPEQLRYNVKRSYGYKIITRKHKDHWTFRHAKS